MSQTSGTTGGAGVYVTSVATTSSAASLTSGGIPVGATSVYFVAEAQAVRYRDDGAAPSATVGMPVAVDGQLHFAAGQAVETQRGSIGRRNVRNGIRSKPKVVGCR